MDPREGSSVMALTVGRVRLLVVFDGKAFAREAGGREWK